MRTFGRTRQCAGCRFWSDMVATHEQGVLKAMCLIADHHFPNSGNMVEESDFCDGWKSGHYGPIDEDGADIARELYEAEERNG
jgi:hypothetical protein